MENLCGRRGINPTSDRTWPRIGFGLQDLCHVHTKQIPETRILNDLPPPGQLDYALFCWLSKKQTEESKPDKVTLKTLQVSH